MKPWIRLTLIGMTVGGGFAGFAFTLQSLFNSSRASTLNGLLTLLFMGLYGLVVASGLLFVYDPTRTGPLLVALAAQVPSISSYLVVYKFAAGLEMFINVGGIGKEGTTGLHLDWELVLGGSWRFALLHDNPLRVGVNVVPLAILILLWRTVHPIHRLAPPPQNW